MAVGTEWGAAGGSPRRGTGHLFMALDVSAFADFGRFTSDMDVYLRSLRQTKPSPGQPRVVYAGMEETEMEAERSASGIPYHPEVIHWYSETRKGVVARTGIGRLLCGC